MISTYLTNSTKFYNFLHNTTISKNYDIIFIHDVNESIDVSAYQRILPGFNFNFSIKHFNYLANKLKHIKQRFVYYKFHRINCFIVL